VAGVAAYPDFAPILAHRHELLGLESSRRKRTTRNGSTRTIPVSAFLHHTFSLEKGLIIGVALMLAGLLALLYFPLSFYAHIFPMGAEAARLDFRRPGDRVRPDGRAVRVRVVRAGPVLLAR